MERASNLVPALLTSPQAFGEVDSLSTLQPLITRPRNTTLTMHIISLKIEIGRVHSVTFHNTYPHRTTTQRFALTSFFISHNRLMSFKQGSLLRKANGRKL